MITKPRKKLTLLILVGSSDKKKKAEVSNAEGKMNKKHLLFGGQSIKMQSVHVRRDNSMVNLLIYKQKNAILMLPNVD